MYISTKTALLAAFLTVGACALSVPANVQELYQSIVAQEECQHPIVSGFFSIGNETQDEADAISYCNDHIDDGVIFLRGGQNKLVNMDVDCDGVPDSRCKSNDTQSETSFRQDLETRAGIADLNANIHSYVVFGNVGSTDGRAQFDPGHYHIQPLSIMAVVCGDNMDKLFYGVWADENGDDDPKPMVGEASISLAQACYPNEGISGENGHDENDVLYLAFPGSQSALDIKGVAWDAKNFNEFHSSIVKAGNSLVAGIGSNARSRLRNA